MNNLNFMHLYIGFKDGFIDRKLVDDIYFVKNRIYFHVLNSPSEFEHCVSLRKIIICNVSLIPLLRLEEMIDKQNESPI